MSTVDDSPELTAVVDAGVTAHERFVRESREMDFAWQAGKLDLWLANKRKELLGEEFYGDDSANLAAAVRSIAVRRGIAN